MREMERVSGAAGAAAAEDTANMAVSAAREAAGTEEQLVSAVDSAGENRWGCNWTRHVLREMAAADRACSGERPEKNLTFGDGGACASRVVCVCGLSTGSAVWDWAARVRRLFGTLRSAASGWAAETIETVPCWGRQAGSPARRARECSHARGGGSWCMQHGAARRVSQNRPCSGNFTRIVLAKSQGTTAFGRMIMYPCCAKRNGK